MFDIGLDGRFLLRTPRQVGQTSGEETLNRLILVENWLVELKERVPTN